MANPGYVRSTDGDNADNGSTWALANANLGNATADHSAGDRIWVSNNHAETTAGAITITLPGTAASPNEVLCGDDAAEPPTALATTARVITTGAGSITVGGFGHFHGITFECGTGNNNSTFTFPATAGSLSCDSCNFKLLSTHTSTSFRMGPIASLSKETAVFENCGFLYSNAAQLTYCAGQVRIKGGSALAGGTTPTVWFAATATGKALDLRVTGFDFTNWGSAVKLVAGGAITQAGLAVFENCTFHADWSMDNLISTAITTPGLRVEVYGKDAAEPNHQIRVHDALGDLWHETTIVRGGGSTDGTTPLSWKMTTSSRARYRMFPFASPWFSQWNETTSAINFAVHIVHDSQGAGSGGRFQDDEIALELVYLSASGKSLGTFITDLKANLLATAADQADSTESWTTTGLTTPVKQKLSVAITPAEKGVIKWRVLLMKASKTVYVDREPEIT